MISIDLSETNGHWKSETTSETIFFADNFFPTKYLFLGFFLGLNFVLDFVSDNIP